MMWYNNNNDYNNNNNDMIYVHFCCRMEVWFRLMWMDAARHVSVWTLTPELVSCACGLLCADWSSMLGCEPGCSAGLPGWSPGVRAPPAAMEDKMHKCLPDCLTASCISFFSFLSLPVMHNLSLSLSLTHTLSLFLTLVCKVQKDKYSDGGWHQISAAQ